MSRFRNVLPPAKIHRDEIQPVQAINSHPPTQAAGFIVFRTIPRKKMKTRWVNCLLST
jgi:hypothetical protein